MIVYDYDACIGCEECENVCPRGVWRINHEPRKAELSHPSRCIECTACEFQCPPRAIIISQSLIPKSPIIIKE